MRVDFEAFGLTALRVLSSRNAGDGRHGTGRTGWGGRDGTDGPRRDETVITRRDWIDALDGTGRDGTEGSDWTKGLDGTDGIHENWKGL